MKSMIDYPILPSLSISGITQYQSINNFRQRLLFFLTRQLEQAVQNKINGRIF
jgi:hypothetical protein